MISLTTITRIMPPTERSAWNLPSPVPSTAARPGRPDEFSLSVGHVAKSNRE